MPSKMRFYRVSQDGLRHVIRNYNIDEGTLEVSEARYKTSNSAVLNGSGV